MLSVAALQVGNPIALIVLVKPDDAARSRGAVGESAAHAAIRGLMFRDAML
jgi:hypothetical protein